MLAYLHHQTKKCKYCIIFYAIPTRAPPPPPPKCCVFIEAPLNAICSQNAILALKI